MDVTGRKVETVREEWRVTGAPGGGYPHYDFTFGSRTRLAMGEDQDPEAEARRFIEMTSRVGLGWAEGPHLESRVITETSWQSEDA